MKISNKRFFVRFSANKRHQLELKFPKDHTHAHARNMAKIYPGDHILEVCAYKECLHCDGVKFVIHTV